MKKLVVLLAVIAAGAILWSSRTKTPPPQAEKVLTIATPYGIGTFSPWLFTSDGDRYVISNVYESLCESNTGAKDGQNFVPILAESWSYTDDTTCVFKLRNDIYWQSEGNELFKEKTLVTASDVKAVFDFNMDKANLATQYGDLISIIDRIDADDSARTVTFHTKTPTSLLIKEVSDVLIFPIKAIREKYNLEEHPVGTGAFIIKEYKVDDSITLVPNPDARVKPNLTKVIFKIVPDKSVAAISLQNKEVDIVPQLLTADIGAVAKRDFLSVLPNTLGWYRYLAFNCEREMFQDVRVRQAIGMCIDQKAIVDTIFGNDFGATIAVCTYSGGVPLELEGADLETWKSLFEYNPGKAEQLLQEAGYQKNASGIYEKDGKALRFVVQSPANDNNRIKFGEMAVTYMKAIGIDAASQPTEWATHTADIRAGNCDMFIMGGGSTIGGMNMLYHSVGMQGMSHNTRLYDKEMDALLDRGYATVDDARRVEILKEAAVHAIKNHVHAAGYDEYVQIGMNRRVRDFDKSPSLWYGLCNEYRNIDVE